MGHQGAGLRMGPVCTRGIKVFSASESNRFSGFYLFIIYFHLLIWFFFFLISVYLFIWKRGRERIPSRLHPVSIEPNVGHDLTNHEIMARVEIKNQMLNWLSRPGASVFLILKVHFITVTVTCQGLLCVEGNSIQLSWCPHAGTMAGWWREGSSFRSRWIWILSVP